MNDPLRRRLQDAARQSAKRADIDAIAARAAQLDHRARIGQLGAAALAAVAVVGIGLALISRSPERTTRLSATTPSSLPSRPQPTRPTTVSVPTTAVPPAVSTSTTSPTTVPWAPASIPAKPGDVDGDGIPDRVSITWNASGATVVADMSRLGHQTISVSVSKFLLGSPASYGPAILGVVDVDRDGHSEILVKVDSGASTTWFTIIKLVNGRLTQVTLGGRPLQLPLQGSVMTSSAVGCGTGRLVEASWSEVSVGPLTFQGELDTYGFSGSRMVLVSKTTHTFITNGQPPSSAQLASAGYLVHCAPLD